MKLAVSYIVLLAIVCSASITMAQHNDLKTNPSINFLLTNNSDISGKDGAPCINNLDCDSNYCQNGYCCQSGDCCNTPGDCTGYASLSVCDNPTTCQGQREDSTCTNYMCGSQSVDDDSACDSNIVANDCGLYTPVYCSGLSNQNAPVCPTICYGDFDCDSAAHCVAGECVPLY